MQLPSSQEIGTCTFTKSNRLLGTRLLLSSLSTLWLSYGQNCLVHLDMPQSYVILIIPSFAWLKLTDERWGWYADLCSDIFRILNVDLVNVEYGREFLAHLWDLYSY